MKRRDFLKLGSSAFGASLFPASALLANSAMAQGAGINAKKFMSIFTPNGVPTDTVKEYWHPPVGTVDLSQRSVSRVLEPIKEHCLFLDGLSMYKGLSSSHEGGMAKALTANGPNSIDVAFGEFHQGSAPYSSLQMGPYSDRRNSMNSSFKAGFMLPTEDKPVTLYQTLWGAKANVDARSSQDLGVLSQVNQDLAKLRTRLGSVEREKLEQHTDALSQLERRILSLSNSDNTKPVINFSNVTDDDRRNMDRFYEMSSIMQDIAVAALSMGLTRSINFLFAEHTFQATMPTGISDHGSSHTGGEVHGESKRIWIGEVLKLLQRMQNTPDGSANLFDNTLAFHYSEIGSGTVHKHHRMPFFLAGGKNWGLNQGTTLEFPYRKEREWYYGTPHHKLLTAIAQRAGLPIDVFGDGADGQYDGAGQGTGPLEGIFV